MRVITTPFLFQVTLVAGPPVEVQVRVLDWSSKAKLVTVGEPAMDKLCGMMTGVLITHDKLHSGNAQTKHAKKFSTLDLGIRIKKPEQVYCEVVKENKKCLSVIYKHLAQNAQERPRNFLFTDTLSHTDVVTRH